MPAEMNAMEKNESRCAMDLRKYDEKPLRLTAADGEVYEGIGMYCDEEYCWHEYGRQEPCIQIVNYLFFPQDIISVEDLSGRPGPYGGFSAPWGLVEEQNVRDGADSIQDVLESDEPVDVLRMLACLDRFLDPSEGLSCRDRVIALLRQYLSFFADQDVRREAERLVEKWGGPTEGG